MPLRNRRNLQLKYARINVLKGIGKKVVAATRILCLSFEVVDEKFTFSENIISVSTKVTG